MNSTPSPTGRHGRAALRTILALIASLLFASGAQSQNFQRVEMELPNGSIFYATQFFSASDSLIIWIPSERGIREGYIPVAKSTLMQGVDIWALDLNSSYMVPRSKAAFEEYEIEDMISLMEMAVADGFKRIMLVSAGRGGPFVLEVGRAWQEAHPDSRELVGYGFIHPHFVEGIPEMGEEASYLPITYTANLPIYLLQPEFSTKFARTREIADALSTGGSKVFIHALRGVRGGFHTKDPGKLQDIDMQARSRLPELFATMMDVMEGLPAPKAPPPPPPMPGMPADGMSLAAAPSPHHSGIREPALHPFRGNPTPPVTVLEELSGEPFHLSSTEGEVVLINFWATWCGPCIKEIPSLKRLVDRMQGKPFRVVAINIGEPRPVIENFIRTFDINFPILLDSTGQAVRDWKVYAYPSNFLIDEQGKIRYAYWGALEWDAESVVATIESAFDSETALSKAD